MEQIYNRACIKWSRHRMEQIYIGACIKWIGIEWSRYIIGQV